VEDKHVVIWFGRPDNRTSLPPPGRFHRVKAILTAVVLASTLVGILLAAIVLGSILAAVIVLTFAIALTIGIGRTLINRARQ
jgi:tetrahydromethanopterin S-methyltransferase subunit E